jgi:hypothetical protein
MAHVFTGSGGPAGATVAVAGISGATTVVSIGGRGPAAIRCLFPIGIIPMGLYRAAGMAGRPTRCRGAADTLHAARARLPARKRCIAAPSGVGLRQNLKP